MSCIRHIAPETGKNRSIYDEISSYTECSSKEREKEKAESKLLFPQPTAS